jgi:hypothetical protein
MEQTQIPDARSPPCHQITLELDLYVLLIQDFSDVWFNQWYYICMYVASNETKPKT